MKSTVDDQVQAMLDLADDLDIPEKSVTASDIQISPEWQYQPERKLIGHQVSREVTFKVSGVERYAELADGLAGLGLRSCAPPAAKSATPTSSPTRPWKKRSRMPATKRKSWPAPPAVNWARQCRSTPRATACPSR